MTKAEKLLKALGASQQEETSLILQNVSKQLEAFNKVINIEPLIKAVGDLQTEFDNRTALLNTHVAEQVKEMKLSIPQDKTGSIMEEIQKVSAELSKNRSEAEVKLEAEIRASKEALDSKAREIVTLIDSKTSELKSKREFKDEIQTLKDMLEEAVKKLTNRLNNIGGGSMNRKITFGGTDYLTRYTDINYKAGANVTITVANNNSTKMVDVTISATGGGGGTVRSINSVSTNTVAGSTSGTDYVYLCTGTMTLTLPTAVGNTNLYTVKNVGTGVVTIDTTSAETVDNDPTVVMPVRYTSVDVISDTANWNIT